MCGGIKKGLPPIEQHPSQIRLRPVQKAQTQKEHWKPSYRETDLLSKQLPFPVLMVQRYNKILK